MNIITIDCGASFIKGAVISDGIIRKKIQKQAPDVQRSYEIFEPVQIKQILTLVKEIILELADGEEEICLCLSNEMHGFILAYEDGMPLTDYISWQKEFGALEIEGTTAMQILGTPDLAEEIMNTGMPLRKGLPSCNLLYLYKKNSCLRDHSQRIVFYTLGDYILRALSGKDPMCHPTNAAATGLYDLVGRKWNGILLQLTNGNEVDFLTVGEEVLNFEFESIVIHAFPAIGDQQAALLGSGLKKEGVLSFNLGTGAQVSVLTEKLEYDRAYQIRPYFFGRYLKTVPHIPSGRALNVYFRFVKDLLAKFHIEISDEDIWDALLKQINIPSRTELMCDLSFFDNAVTTCNKGAIENIGEYDFTIENLITAVIDSMVQNFVSCAKRIEEKPENIEHIVFSGGIARRFEILRKEIGKNYPFTQKIDVVEDETLIGLCEYGTMLLEGD